MVSACAINGKLPCPAAPTQHALRSERCPAHACPLTVASWDEDPPVCPLSPRVQASPFYRGRGTLPSGAAGLPQVQQVQTQYSAAFRRPSTVAQDLLPAFPGLDLWPRSKVLSKGKPNKPAQGPEPSGCGTPVSLCLCFSVPLHCGNSGNRNPDSIPPHSSEPTFPRAIYKAHGASAMNMASKHKII